MPSATEIVLNPCCRCGADAVLREQLMIAGFSNQTSEFIVLCTTCIQRGQWRDSRFEASAIWNEQNKVRT